MNKKEKRIFTGIVLVYMILMMIGYATKVLDWETMKSNYLIGPGLGAITFGLGKKWFGFTMLISSIVGIVVYSALLLFGVAAPAAIINIALLAVGVIIGVVLDIRKKDA